jgi:hypothetical protein
VTGRYLAVVLLLGAAGGLVLAIVRTRLEPEVMQGALVGGTLAVAGAIAGLLLSAWGFDKGQTQFFGALLFGILGRLVVYGATLIYVALGTSIDPLATAVAMLGFHVVFMILEIHFALRRLRAGSGRQGA